MRADWRLPRLAFGRYTLAGPTPASVAHVAANLRAADQEEVHASLGSRDFDFALRLSVSCADDTIVVHAPDGEPIAVFGVSTVSLISNIGAPWMLATDRAQVHRSALVRSGRAYTVAMLEQYQRLENWVDARNTRAVAWLQRCGYALGEPQPYGALRLPFHPFSITR